MFQADSLAQNIFSDVKKRMEKLQFLLNKKSEDFEEVENAMKRSRAENVEVGLRVRCLILRCFGAEMLPFSNCSILATDYAFHDFNFVAVRENFVNARFRLLDGTKGFHLKAGASFCENTHTGISYMRSGYGDLYAHTHAHTLTPFHTFTYFDVLFSEIS